MQPIKYRTSPTFDALDPGYYGIKESMFPENRRILKVIEWFKFE